MDAITDTILDEETPRARLGLLLLKYFSEFGDKRESWRVMYATTARLTLAQRSVLEKTNEITTIPNLLD